MKNTINKTKVINAIDSMLTNENGDLFSVLEELVPSVIERYEGTPDLPKFHDDYMKAWRCVEVQMYRASLGGYSHHVLSDDGSDIECNRKCEISPVEDDDDLELYFLIKGTNDWKTLTDALKDDEIAKTVLDVSPVRYCCKCGGKLKDWTCTKCDTQYEDLPF